MDRLSGENQRPMMADYNCSKCGCTLSHQLGFGRYTCHNCGETFKKLDSTLVQENTMAHENAEAELTARTQVWIELVGLLSDLRKLIQEEAERKSKLG